MAFYGVDQQVRIQEFNLKLKNQIRSKGGIGLRNLATIFKKFDVSGNKKLDAIEFEHALNSYG